MTSVICSIHLHLFMNKRSRPLPPKQTPAGTVTCEANLSLSTVKRSGLTVTCSSAGSPSFSVWVLLVDTLNTNCKAISSVFDNNYLRFDVVKSFFYYL